MRNTIIISGFPGVGKSYFCGNTDLNVLDSDSSCFSWTKDLLGNNIVERNPDFPVNYIKHIKENIGTVDIIFVSSHEIVRKALEENNIHYILAFPGKDCKEEYIVRYKQRGNTEEFIDMIDENWNKFISDMEYELFPLKISMSRYEYISDLIKYGYCPSNNPSVYRYIAKGLYNYRGCPIYCDECDYRVDIFNEREEI